MTYLDVSTDWVLQGAGLIKQYRDMSRRAASTLEFTVLQETTRPNRFAIVEGWSALDCRTVRDALGSAAPTFPWSGPRGGLTHKGGLQ